MPLNTVPDPFELSSYQGINENFVIFYSSRDEESGRMWCPVRLFPRSEPAETLPRAHLGPPSKRSLRLDLCFQILDTYTQLCSPYMLIAAPPPGLPGCGRHHRAHFRTTRWAIRIDHLRWSESRVRPILFAPRRPLRPPGFGTGVESKIVLFPHRRRGAPFAYRCELFGFFFFCFSDGKRRETYSARRPGALRLYRQSSS